MKRTDKEFIREIVSSDLKPISNPDFIRVTLDKIAASEKIRSGCTKTGDITLLMPVIIYASLYSLLAIISDVFSRPDAGPIDSTTHFMVTISEYFMHPVTLSILIAFTLLYVIDLCIRKIHA